MTEDEMAGWHHQLDGHVFEWTPGVGDGQGGQECCDSWSHRESDTTERLNWTEHWQNDKHRFKDEIYFGNICYFWKTSQSLTYPDVNYESYKDYIV